MFTPMASMHMLSRHSPIACGGIGVMAGITIGVGPIMDGTGVGIASTSVGEAFMPVGVVGMVPVGVGITIIIIPVIGDRETRILHEVIRDGVLIAGEVQS